MHIAFDADDTLWHNEPIFELTQERVARLLADFVPADELGEKLAQTERRNLRLFGYGAKGFTLALMETALEVSGGEVPGAVLQQILNAGKAMIEHPVELLPGVAETVGRLATDHPLLLITKGELFHQESKIARSGLAGHFAGIEIVSEKDEQTYRKILERYSIDAERFVMIGNSVKSDILPVLAIGGNAVHVHYESTWELDKIEHRGAEEEGFFEADSMRDVPRLLEEIAAQGWGSS